MYPFQNSNGVILVTPVRRIYKVPSYIRLIPFKPYIPTGVINPGYIIVKR